MSGSWETLKVSYSIQCLLRPSPVALAKPLVGALTLLSARAFRSVLDHRNEVARHFGFQAELPNLGTVGLDWVISPRNQRSRIQLGWRRYQALRDDAEQNDMRFHRVTL